MFPLDVTHQVLTAQRYMDRLQALGTPVAIATVQMLDYYRQYDQKKYGTDGGPLHDPCTIAWLIDPGLFSGKKVNVEVEVSSPLTIGQTVVDHFAKTGRPANVTYIRKADEAGFWNLLIDRLARL